MRNDRITTGKSAILMPLTIWLAFCPAFSGASQKDEGQRGAVSASFLQITPSVRLAGLGGHQAAARGSVADMNSNPAGLSAMTVPELWLTHNQSFEKSKYETMALGFPHGKQTFAALAQYIDHGSYQRVDMDSQGNLMQGLGEFRWSTWQLNLAYARRLHNKLSWGVTTKGWNEKRVADSAAGWAADVGVQATELWNHWDIGVSLRNAGPRFSGYSLPRTTALGAGYHLFPKNKFLTRFSLLSEVGFSAHEDPAIRSGVEISNQRIWLRGGYQSLTKDVSDPLAQFSLGAGFRIDGWSIDYAWEPRGELGDQHRISLTLALGLTPQQKAERAQELDRAMEARMKLQASNHSKLAKQAEIRQEWETAVNNYTMALTWDPGNKEVQDRLAMVQNKFVLEKADRHYKEGLALAKQDQWLEAAFQWKQAQKLDPQHTEAAQWLNSAQYKIKTEEGKVSSSAVERAYNKGVHHYLEGRYGDAITEWSNVLILDPKRPHLREYIEKAKFRKLEKEMVLMQKERSAERLQADVLNRQAYTLYSLGRVEQAVALWEKILTVEPGNQDAATALKEGRKKLSLITDTYTSHMNEKVRDIHSKALKAYSGGQFDEAAALWRQAIELEPDNRWIQNGLRRAEIEAAADRNISRAIP